MLTIMNDFDPGVLDRLREKRSVTYLSLGAGVQSSTLALMFSEGPVGDHSVPDVAIFSDTGAEPAPVYEWLEWLEPRLSFPVMRVQWRDGLEENISGGINGERVAVAPFYTESPNGKGMLRRQCTQEFKVKPLTSAVRFLVGLTHGERAKDHRATAYLGISWDEIQRVRESHVAWISHQWPLIDLKMSRAQCLEWMDRKEYPQPPKSACYFCPFRSNREWLWLRENSPDDWEKAIDFDRKIRGGVRGTRERLFLHQSLRPLDEIALIPEDNGQMSLWDGECEGMCGL